MKCIIQTPSTDTYVEDFITKLKANKNDRIRYNIKDLTGDLTILKNVVRQNLRYAKSEYEYHKHSDGVEKQLSEDLYNAYRLFDVLIRGAKEIKE